MTLTAALADAHLDHLALVSNNAQGLAQFHADAMDMVAAQVSANEWRCEGPGRRLIISSGEAPALAYAAFACRDSDGLNALRERATEEGLGLHDCPSPWFEPGGFGVRDPDGHLICFGLADGQRSEHQGIDGVLQHLTIASADPDEIMGFYAGKLGFRLTDRVFDDAGALTGCFMTSTHQHHTVACFRATRQGLDHYSHEVAEWNTIRDWCDHFAARHIKVTWGPGRHGPGNNLFAFIRDPDGNMIEISAELEIVGERPVKDWRQEPRTLNLWGKAIDRMAEKPAP